jgi:hypothetical protein
LKSANGDYYRDPLTPEDQPTPQYLCRERIYSADNTAVLMYLLVTEIRKENKQKNFFIPGCILRSNQQKNNSNECYYAKNKRQMTLVALIDALVEEAN